MKEYKAPIAIHPYETIKDVLKQQYEDKIKIYNKDIDKITAVKLEVETGLNREFWLELQKNYNATVERLSNNDK